MTQLVGKYSICLLLYHTCFLTKRKAFLSIEMPEIQIYNPFYFLMKLIGKLLCKKKPSSSHRRKFVYRLFSFTYSYHSLIKLLKEQFLIFKGHNITNCFPFYNQTKAQILRFLCPSHSE